MPTPQSGDLAGRSSAPGGAARRLRLGLLLLNGVLAGVFVYLVVSSRTHQIQEDEDHVRNVAQLMALVIGEALDGPAAMLEATRRALERPLAEGEFDRDSLARAVEANSGLLDGAFRIGIADADGRRVCARSAAPCQAIDLSDRDYFERLRAHPDDPVGLYGPYPSRVDGAEGMALALALRGRGHGFAGVAVVLVPVKTLQSAVDRVELGTHGVASVRTADLRLVQHRGDPAGSAKAATLGPESALQRAVQAAPDSGIYRAPSESDAIERVVAYLRLSNYPLYVQAGEDVEANLSRWRRNSAVGLILILCFAAASWLMVRATNIRQREYERAERLAREQAAMLDTDLIGIVRLRERKVGWANRGAELIFGYPRGGLVGVPVRSANPDEEWYQRARLEAIAESGYFRVQRQVLRKDGSSIWIDESSRVLSSDVDDQLVVIVDISPLKQAEESRARAAELQSQNVRLREVNQQKSVFLANMSHELRTPLNAIMGFGGLLERDSNLSPKYRDWAAKIGASGRHLLTLIDNVLDVSRLEAGRLEVRAEAVALGPLIEQCLGLVGARAASRGVELVAVCRDGAATVRADRERLEQVLVQLLSNAIKFNRVDGRVEVNCSAAGAWVRVEVSDAGAGLDAAQRARLFAPFERLDSNRLYVEGTGIGLALSKRLVESMGGRIGVDSTPGAGSTFWVELQVIDESAAGGERQAFEQSR